METSTIKLLTIYTEAALESTLKRVLDKNGVEGYTIINARGKGRSGSRNAFWEANSNIRVEVLCEEAIAQQLIEELHRKYGENYALMTYVVNATVMW